jgi:hypothetical protein
VRTTTARGTGSAPRSASTTAAPAPPPAGVFDSVKGKWSNLQASVKETLAERSARQNKEAVAQAAASYEKRAKQKRDMQKRGGR